MGLTGCWVPVTWKPRLGERNCFCPCSGHGAGGLAVADNAMIVGGGGPRAVVLWSQAAVTAAPQAVVS